MELCNGHKSEFTSETSKFISLEGVQGLKGKICTVLGKKFILALIQSSIELVIMNDCFSSTDDQWNFLGSRKTRELTCNFLYESDSKPYFLENLDDGTEVNFDALRYGNSGNYLAFIVWIGPKCPSIIVEPLANTHILYRQHLGVPVKILYMFKDSGNLSFESCGISIYVQFFKGVTKIKMNGLIGIEWSAECFLQNFSKFVANIYEFRNNSMKEEPKFICTHLWLNSEDPIYSEAIFNYKTLYNFDYNGAQLNNIKPLGIIKHCYQTANISTSSTSFNISLTVNNNQEYSFSCPLNKCLNNQIKSLLDKNNKAAIQVHVKEVSSEQQRWSLYLVLNKIEDSFKSEIILKTFGEPLSHPDTISLCNTIISGKGSVVNDEKCSVTSEQNDLASNCNFNEKNLAFSIQKSDSNTSIAKSDLKSSKLDLMVSNFEEPLLPKHKTSISEDSLSKNSNCTINVSKSKTEVHILKVFEDNQCMLHPKKHGCKRTSNKHGDKLLQHECMFDKAETVDSSNVELWKEYFKNETPQISEATEILESRNTSYQTTTEFFNSILKPSTQTDILKSCHFFNNSLKLNPLSNSIDTPGFPLALLNAKGSMFALKEKVLILTTIFNKNVLIATKYTKNHFNYSNFSIPLLLWRDGKPAPLTEFVKGFQVHFDAVLASEHNYYQALLIWTGTKPNFIPYLKLNAGKTLMLSDVYDNEYVTQTVSKSGEKQLEFIDGCETKVCRPFENFKFKANKKIKGQISKLIAIHNDKVIAHYIFSSHSNCLELEFGQCYTKDVNSEAFNELPNYGGLYLDVPIKMQLCQDLCIIKFNIEDERISMSTKQPNLQELFRYSTSTECEGSAHVFRQSSPQSFNVLLVSIKEEDRSEFSDENRCSISNSGIRATQTNFVFNVNDNHFQVIEIEVEVDPTFDPQETSLSYINLPKLTFSPECKSVAAACMTSPVTKVIAETSEILLSENNFEPNALKTVCEVSAKEYSVIPALDSHRSIRQNFDYLLNTSKGKVSDSSMCYNRFFHNCPGTLYLKNKMSVIDIVSGTKHIEIFPLQDGFMQVNGKARKLLSVDKPASIKLDMFYDAESKRHKITALWAGKKPKAMIVSNQEQHLFDVLGQLLGIESRTVKLKCLINGNLVSIVSYKSKRVFDENGTKTIDELAIGCPVLVHLKKIITEKKPRWEILMMISLTDKIINHLFPTSVESRRTNNLLYTASMISKLNTRKLQINEISNIWKELTSKHFTVIFGKIISAELESVAIEGTYGGVTYNFVLKTNHFLDSLCELSTCEVCLIGVSQVHQLTPYKILTGWFKRLLVNCFILVDHTHEQIEDNIVKLKSSADNNACFAFMTKKVSVLSNSPNKSSLYYLVQHCPPVKSLGHEITKIVLLCSDSWFLVLTCMMILSKEFDGKINDLKDFKCN